MQGVPDDRRGFVTKDVVIAVDAMGGDHAPTIVLDGVRRALAEDEALSVRLVGPSEVVEPFAQGEPRCIPCAASEVIAMSEHPAHAVKAKRDSSIVVGCGLVKAKQADGFFSAGSTGACLAAATLGIGRIKGVKRPALGVVIPSYDRPCLLMDVGANADCKPAYLRQFAIMGSVYMSRAFGVSHPRVGLLNIGEEETKGSILAQDAYALLSEGVEGFAGNCEGGDLLAGSFDVVVTDGFTGNVCLKTIEGTSKLLFRYVRDSLSSSLASKLGALLVRGGLTRLKERISPDAYGGTPLIGIDGVCMIGHGSSNATAIKNGVLASAREAREGLVEAISDAIASDLSAGKEGKSDGAH